MSVKREHRPEWWDWELRVSPHAILRMPRRHFNEADLRAMLQDATDVRPDVVSNRWVIGTRLHDRAWEVVVEPDETNRLLVVVTAYAVE